VEGTFFKGSYNSLISRTIVYNLTSTLPNRKIGFPAFDIGMERELWGLTFFAVVDFVSMVVELKKRRSDLRLQIDEQFCLRLKSHIVQLVIEEENEEVRKMIMEIYVSKRRHRMKPKL
jgi:hypothetical protein